MNTTKIETAARLLLEARSSGKPLPALPPDCVPDDSAHAYAIQDAVAAAMGPVGGWKVGAKGPAAEPTCAPLPAALIYAAPRSFASSTFKLRGIEAEIALRLKQDLPPRAQPYSSAEVAAAVGSVHPALEIVESRYLDFRQQDPLSLLADALSNGAFVYGEGHSDRLVIDQSAQAVELYFNTDKCADVIGGNPAGDILRLLTWLANHVARRCGGLRAGQIVTTGSCTGLLFAGPDTRVSALFAGLGRVELSFEAAADEHSL